MRGVCEREAQKAQLFTAHCDATALMVSSLPPPMAVVAALTIRGQLNDTPIHIMALPPGAGALHILLLYLYVLTYSRPSTLNRLAAAPEVV
jgi:hypothetical protein